MVKLLEQVPVSGWVDLAQPLYEGMSCPTPHGVPSFVFEELPAAIEGGTISITKLVMGAHAGTHVDAARHFIPGGPTIDEYPLDRFAGSGVVLDVRRVGIVPVTAEDLEAASPKIRENDIVFLWLGYAQLYGTPAYEEHPYLTEDAAEYLVSKSVRMLGVDVITPDAPAVARRQGFDFPVHTRLLGNDVLIVENLGPGLAHLAGKRAMLAALPLRIVGADGAPTAVFGWVEEDDGEADGGT